MAYATQTQISLAAGGDQRFLELFDWDGDGVVDALVVSEAQSRADGWIDGYLRGRYATPIATPSDTLIRLSADECVYWARKKRGLLAQDQQDLEDRKDRERQLEAMGAGKIRPDEPPPEQSTAVVAGVVENESPISRRGLKGSFW